MPGEAGCPVICSLHYRSPNLLAMSVRDRVDGLLGVVAVGAQHDRRAALRGEHHHAHDALAIHLGAVREIVISLVNFAASLDDLRGGPSMQAVLVEDLDGSFDHQRSHRDEGEEQR